MHAKQILKPLKLKIIQFKPNLKSGLIPFSFSYYILLILIILLLHLVIIILLSFEPSLSFPKLNHLMTSNLLNCQFVFSMKNQTNYRKQYHLHKIYFIHTRTHKQQLQTFTNKNIQTAK